MPTLRATDPPIAYRLDPTQSLTIVAPSGSSATVTDPSDMAPSATIAGTTTTLGPYSQAQNLVILCTAGAVSWAVAAASAAAASAAFGITDSLTLDSGSYTYSGPAHYTPDHLGVWRYRHTNVPPQVGARLAYNWLDYADTPSLWYALGSGGSGSTWSEVSDTDATGAVVKALATTFAASTESALAQTAPLGIDWTTARPTFMPGVIAVAAFDVRRVSGTQAGNTYHRPIDSGIQPSESRGGSHAVSSTWKRITHAMQANMMLYGLGVKANAQANETGEHRIARVMLDFASGIDASAWVPGEYVPCPAAAPGWKYFATLKANSRANNPADATALLNQTTGGPDTVSVQLTEATGAAIAGSDPFKGVLQEPAVTNLCDHDNYLSGIGWGKASSTGSYTATVPFQQTPGTPTEALRFEVQSMARHPYNGYLNQIATVQGVNDTITNSANDFLAQGWKVGDGIWGWVSNDAADGVILPLTSVTAVAAGTLTLASTLTIPVRAAAGARKVRLLRVPKVGDQVLLLLNSGATHRTTTTSVVLPSYNATWQTKDAVRCALTANPPSDGGFSNTDNGVHFFYWTSEADFGITLSATTTMDIVYVRETLRAAGLDELAPHGLALQFTTGSTSPANIDFGNNAGTASRDAVISAFLRKVSGGACNLTTVGGTNTTFANATWARVRTNQFALAGANKPRLQNYTTATVVQVLGMQFEQSSVATANSCAWTSPIVNPKNGTAGTRAAKRWTQAWATQTSSSGTISKVWKRNNFSLRLDFTPSAALLGVTQCLWSVGDTTHGASLLLGGANADTWTWRKTVASVNTDITVTLQAVAGTTYSICADISAADGMALSVNGITAATNTTTAGKQDISALLDTTTQDLGSALGTAVAAFGALRKTPSAAGLVY